MSYDTLGDFGSSEEKETSNWGVSWLIFEPKYWFKSSTIDDTSEISMVKEVFIGRDFLRGCGFFRKDFVGKVNEGSFWELEVISSMVIGVNWLVISV